MLYKSQVPSTEETSNKCTGCSLAGKKKRESEKDGPWVYILPV